MSEQDKLNIDDTIYDTEVPEYTFKPYSKPDISQIRAFIPGTIIDILVKPGDKVEEGQVLLLLDAMKMHNEICALRNGTITRIYVSRDDVVEKNKLMMEVR